MRKYNIPREKLVILTKCFFPLTDDPKAGRIMPDQANDRDYIMKKGDYSQILVGTRVNHRIESETYFRGRGCKFEKTRDRVYRCLANSSL